MARIWSISLILFIVLLAGCGGDSTAPQDEPDPGSTFPPLGVTEVTGTVVGAEPAEVVNSLGGVPVESGAFTFEQIDGGRQLAVAVSAGGTPMLLGWLDADHSTLSPRTTVDVLMFYASGAFMLPSAMQLEVMERLAETPELNALAADLADLLAADPDALSTAPTALIADLQTLIDDMLASLEDAPLAATDAPDKGVIVSGGVQSGLRVDTVAGINSITLTNTYRRLCHAFVERTATVDDEGVVTPDPAALTDFEMTATQRLNGAVGSLVDIIWGRYAMEETSAPPLPLPTVEGAARTRYELTVVGPGASNGDLSRLSAAQLDKQQEVVRTFVVRDLFLPLVVSVLIPNTNMDDYIRFVGGGDVVQDFVNILGGAVPGIWDQAYAGDIDGALGSAYDAVMGSGTLRDAVLQRVVDHITDMRGFDAAEVAVGRAQSFIRIMTAVDMFLASFDASAVGAAIVASDRANVWTIDVTEPEVVLAPESAEISFGETVDLTATVPEASGSDADLVYKWITDGEHGTLTDGIPGHENTFDSTRNEVVYTAGDAHPGEETVTVQAYALAGPGQSERQLIGETSAVITVRPGIVSISPTSTTVGAGQTATFTVQVDPEPGEGDLSFTWTGGNQHGTLDPQPDGRSAVYTADLTGEGEDQVSVRVTQMVDGENVDWGSAAATVTVGPLAPSQTTSRLWQSQVPGRQEGYFGYIFVWGYVFPAVEGASTYELTVITPSGNPESNLEVGDVRILHAPDASGSSWYDAEALIEAYDSNVLGLQEGELCYLYAWMPTTNWDQESINENLPIWQARVAGDMQLVWEVRVEN